MARSGKAYTSEDIWHLSIDDLLSAPKEPAHVAGGGPFVINLSTSTARIGPPPKGLRGVEGLQVYQLRRGPEGQPQFLLRLGIIATEVEADAILSSVLEHYPAATIDSADDDDKAVFEAEARSAEPRKPAQRAAENVPEARQAPPIAASSPRTRPPSPLPSPPVAAKPKEPFRWDIDELLPDLPVTRSSQPKRKTQKRSPPAVRPKEEGATRAQMPATAAVPSDRDTIASAAAASPAVGDSPSLPELQASQEAATQGDVGMQRELLAPPLLREAPPVRETPSLPEPSNVSALPAQTELAQAIVAEVALSAEIESSAPSLAEGVPTRAVTEEIDSDYDPNAATHEVEIPAFTIEVLSLEARASAPEVQARNDAAPSVESQAPDPIALEMSPSEVTSETSTIDARELDAVTLEAPASQVRSEGLTTEAHEFETITVEASAIEVRSRALATEAHESDTTTREAAAIEVTSEVLTIEARELDVVTWEAGAVDVAASESPTIEAYAPELLAADAVPEPALYEGSADSKVEPAAPEEDTPAFPTAARAPVDDAPCVSEVSAQVDAASAPKPDVDSGTLERLVAKIEALVEVAGANDQDANYQDATPPQNTGAVRAPTPLAKPTVPLAAGARPHSAREASPPRAPVAESPPAEAPAIDSTQTIRALTPLELADDQSSQWFSIQLALSEEHIDSEHVPSLDIFNEYRLYSVTGLDQDRVMHALRLGFFSSELAAEAVAGYLRGFFDAPCIKRVSLAERERFAQNGVTARKDVGATGVHTAIELAGPAPLPERRAKISQDGRDREPRSIWSRLVAALRR